MADPFAFVVAVAAVHPRAVERSPAGIEQLFRRVFAGARGFRPGHMAVDVDDVAFGEAVVSRPDRLAGTGRGIGVVHDVVAEGRQVEKLAVFPGGFYQQDRVGTPAAHREADAAAGGGDVFVIDAVIADGPVAVGGCIQLHRRIIPEVPVPFGGRQQPGAFGTFHLVFGGIPVPDQDSGPVAAGLGVRKEEVIVIAEIHVDGQPELLQVVFAGRSPRDAARPVQRGQQHRGQNGDDCNNHQKFDQSEGGTFFLHVQFLSVKTVMK